jgi:hypothetical protein
MSPKRTGSPDLPIRPLSAAAAALSLSSRRFLDAPVPMPDTRPTGLLRWCSGLGALPFCARGGATPR